MYRFPPPLQIASLHPIDFHMITAVFRWILYITFFPGLMTETL